MKGDSRSRSTAGLRNWAVIDRAALRHNLAKVQQLCPGSEIVAVVKANAYGHGDSEAVRTILESGIPVAAFAVATLEEAEKLRAQHAAPRIVLLSGFPDEHALQRLIAGRIEPVIHRQAQVERVVEFARRGEFSLPVWLKQNSGMNRLGLAADACYDAWQRLQKETGLHVILMSHLAYADDLENPESSIFTRKQIERFDALRERVADSGDSPPASFAASAGIHCLPETHHDFVRPGIMLYGGSVLAHKTGPELDLRPVMSFKARVMAINLVAAGESIGYGATWTCDRATRVGVVSVGYADGYPRSAANGTPVLVANGNSTQRTTVIGRVSMDMITIDLTGMDDVEVGSDVTLWGEGLSADEVASHAGTISYELFCKVTDRVPFFHVDSEQEQDRV